MKTLNRPSKHLDNENFVEESKNKLTKAGIKATKYHYSKMESKQCTVRVSKDLKKRGFKFVGSTIIYAYMQAIGMVNDHAHDCAWRQI